MCVINVTNPLPKGLNILHVGIYVRTYNPSLRTCSILVPVYLQQRLNNIVSLSWQLTLLFVCVCVSFERCVGGQLEWITSGRGGIVGSAEGTTVSGPMQHHLQQHTWTLCGANERYSPPAILFSDDDVSPATLILKLVPFSYRDACRVSVNLVSHL